MSLEVSVVLATYNGEKYLAEQLASIATQTRAAAELVVTDDGSTDSTLGLVGDFAKSAPFPVRVLGGADHLGWADNFIRGLRSASGDAIALCDQDDVWRPDKLARQVAVLEQEPSVTAVTHAWNLLRNGETQPVEYGRLGRSGLIARGSAETLGIGGTPGMTMMVRRDVVQETVRLWPAKNRELIARHGFWILPHDAFALEVAVALGDIRVLPEPLVAYRQHGLNVANRAEDSVLSFNWRPDHRGVDAWRELGVRFGERVALYRELLPLLPSPVAQRVFATRADMYERRARAYQARVAVYTESTFTARLRGLRRLLRGGYPGRRGFWVVAATVRDVAAVAGWR